METEKCLQMSRSADMDSAGMRERECEEVMGKYDGKTSKEGD